MSDLLTTKEFCAIARISEITAAQWRREGRGPRWAKLPNTRWIRYRREDVEAWLAGGTVGKVMS